MRKSKLLPILTALVNLALPTPVLAQSSSPDQAVQAVVARLDPDGIQRANIMGGEYFFDPAHLTVKVNIPVELTIAKEAGIVPHSIVIDAPQSGITVDEEMGANPRKIAFTPTAVGVYPYFCSKKLLFFKSHRGKGMEGVLEVVP